MNDVEKALVEKGIEQGLKLALVIVLICRRIKVRSDERERILPCHDRRLLERWIRQAVTAESIDEALRGPAEKEPWEDFLDEHNRMARLAAEEQARAMGGKTRSPAQDLALTRELSLASYQIELAAAEEEGMAKGVRSVIVDMCHELGIHLGADRLKELDSMDVTELSKFARWMRQWGVWPERRE